jgi:hypothetical protein
VLRKIGVWGGNDNHLAGVLGFSHVFSVKTCLGRCNYFRNLKQKTTSVGSLIVQCMNHDFYSQDFRVIAYATPKWEEEHTARPNIFFNKPALNSVLTFAYATEQLGSTSTRHAMLPPA